MARQTIAEIRRAVDALLARLPADGEPDGPARAAVEALRADGRRAVDALLARYDRAMFAAKRERVRLEAMLEPERAARSRGFLRVCGVDEAGRGPLAGPVVAAAVILPDGFLPAGVNDSKKLDEARREEIYGKIASEPGVAYAVGMVAPHVIDRLNILNATFLAMRQAIAALAPAPDHALVDGWPIRALALPQTALVGGDGLSVSIACASIVAKVTRDRLMKRLARRFPHWGFEVHKGYGTPDHLDAIRRHGPSPIHRRSFRGAGGDR